MCGFDVQHAKQLTAPESRGGWGLSPAEVGRLTLDQAQLLLTSDKSLGGRRSVSTGEALSLTGEDGGLRAKSADGREIRLRHGGKSVAARLREAAEGPPARRAPNPKAGRRKG